MSTSEVDVEAVWCSDSVNYDSWICQLLCYLISSCGIHDELFQLLSPVCHVKVRDVHCVVEVEYCFNGTDC